MRHLRGEPERILVREMLDLCKNMISFCVIIDNSEWNKELELTAQRWANQCVKHSVPDIKDTCRDLDGVYVGQNIATIYGDSPGLAPLSLVDVWYMELLNVNSTILPHYKPSTESGFSHYDYFTQLMWAKSFQVGCGGVKFRERMPDTSGAVKRMIYRLVCNFAPGGNRLNHSVYTEGAPCEQCPSDTTCDSIYKSLCSSKKFKTHTVLPETTEPFTNAQSRTRRKKHRTTSAKSKTTMESEFLEASTRVLQTGDDHYTPFDYFSHIHEYVSSSITITTTKKVSSCKDIMAVDDFVELLKKKLSTDPMFKEILFTTKYSPLGNSDNPYDASVAALVSKIYSKKTYPTTTKMPDSEYVNSTLLVDLVEAVIFRSGDKIRSTEVYKSTYPILDVSPVKIQAELAEVRPNSDFTGHYFFPEEEVREDEFSSEMTESYYDAQSPPISDVVLEIEDLKRSKATKDFLDDILESESIAERTENININNIKREASKGAAGNLDDDNRQKRKSLDAVNRVRSMPTNPRNLKKSLEMSCRNYIVKYSDLLGRLASDLKILKLNERFHCSRNAVQKLYFSICHIIPYIFMLIKIC